MRPSELAELGVDTDGLVPDTDYVPDPVIDDDGMYIDVVLRAFLQLEQLGVLGGVNALGGSKDRLDEIHLAMEDGIDLVAAVDRFGDDQQRRRARELIAAGQVSG